MGRGGSGGGAGHWAPSEMGVGLRAGGSVFPGAQLLPLPLGPWDRVGKPSGHEDGQLEVMGLNLPVHRSAQETPGGDRLTERAQHRGGGCGVRTREAGSSCLCSACPFLLPAVPHLRSLLAEHLIFSSEDRLAVCKDLSGPSTTVVRPRALASRLGALLSATCLTRPSTEPEKLNIWSFSRILTINSRMKKQSPVWPIPQARVCPWGRQRATLLP